MTVYLQLERGKGDGAYAVDNAGNNITLQVRFCFISDSLSPEAMPSTYI